MAIKLDILAFGAHPDDVELGCGATLAKYVDMKKNVGIIDLTRGELATRGNVEIRDAESKKSANILGVKVRENLGFSDCFFLNDKSHQLEVVKVIRKYRPDIILCNAINDRHPDHSKASKLVSVSSFLSGLKKINTQQPKWRPKSIYHYIQFNHINPDFVIDVSKYMDKKLLAVKAFASQFFNPNSDEPETIISSKQFLESITYRAADLGRLSGCKYAEGFTSEKTLLLKNFSNIT